jgi:hypothetical protein
MHRPKPEGQNRELHHCLLIVLILFCIIPAPVCLFLLIHFQDSYFNKYLVRTALSLLSLWSTLENVLLFIAFSAQRRLARTSVKKSATAIVW